MSTRLPDHVDIDVVARLVRGDSHNKISEELGIAVDTVAAIKKRQSSALAVINTKVAEKKQLRTLRILDKAHELLEKKLTDADAYEELVAAIELEYANSDMTKEDQAVRKAALKAISKPTVSELVTISKEMFHESQVEQGKPTSIAAAGSREEQTAELQKMVQALDIGDEIELQRLTFKKVE